MDEDLSLIEQTKRLLARVDAMQRSAHELRAELIRYGRALQAQLAALQEATAAVEHDGQAVQQRRDEASIPLVEAEPAPPAPPAPRTPTREEIEGPKTPTPRSRPKREAIREAIEGPSTPVPKPRPDRRQSVRRQGPPVPLFLSYSKTGDDPFKGWINDCSQVGIGVMVEWALPVSSILTVRPVNAPARLKWFQVEVRQCRKIKDRWHLGCKFLQDMVPEDLDLFEP